MRHRKKGRKLSRTASHRLALRRNLAAALLRRERVITTPPKAKEVRPFVERLITWARRALPFRDTGDPADRARYLHYYRLALQRLQDKEMVQKLFGEGKWRNEQESLAARYAERPGGYTRIVRLGGNRLGVPVGTTVSSIPELTYEIGGTERVLRLTGNRLGDNAPQVLFELVEKEKVAPAEAEIAPSIAVSETPEEVSESDEQDEATPQ
jgi:large subunit ribosomal protein L17